MNRNANLKWSFGLLILLSAFSLTAYNADVKFTHKPENLLKTELSTINGNKGILPSHPTDHFRSKATGNWSDITTWESSPDETDWHIALIIPTSEAKSIRIRSTHVVTLTDNTTAKLLTIEAGATLTNSGPEGGYNLTIVDDGTPTEPDLKIYGTYLLFGKPPAFATGATATVYENGLVRVDDNIGGGSDAFARSEAVYFETDAVFEWNNTNIFATSKITYFPNSLPTDIPIFKVSENPENVGSGSGASSPLIINGILDVNADFTFYGGSNKLFRNGIVGSSTLAQAAGSFTINGSNAILGGSALNIILINPMNLESSISVPKDSSVTISGRNLNNGTTGNIFSIEGTLDVTEIQVSPNTTVNVTGTGIFRTSRQGGFSGSTSSIPGGIVTLSLGSTVEFYRNGNQDFENRSDFSNIIFSGGGTKRASSGFDPIGTITIKDSAILDSRGQNIGNDQTNLTMMDSSVFILNTTGRNPAIDGIYNLTGGLIQFNNSDITKQTIRGTYGPTPGTPVIYNNIEVTGKSVGNSSGNINLREGGKFIIKSGGVFEINANAIKAVTGIGSQQVIVESDAEFKTGNKLGFHGLESTEIPIGVSSIHSNISDIILQPNSIVNYHRTGDSLHLGAQTITSSTPYQHPGPLCSKSDSILL